jgi:pepF/M3 family oligoendopeptidase
VTDTLPRWRITDVYDSVTSRNYTDALEQATADITRLVALFDQHDIRAMEPRQATAADGAAADAAIRAYNDLARHLGVMGAYAYALVTTDSRDEQGQAARSQIQSASAAVSPLLSRLAEWVQALGPESLAVHSAEATEHLGTLRILAARAEHQMSESDEHLYAELSTTGSASWARLHADVTSQLMVDVALPEGQQHLPMPAVRGLASHPDPAVRRAAYDAELAAWPQVATTCAAALNAIKGEADIVNRRRSWPSPLDASLYANNVSRPTFDAMQAAVVASLPRFRSWMRTKASLHGHDGALPWSDLFAPLPTSDSAVSWQQGVDLVRDAFATYSPTLAQLVDRAVDEQWIDVGPRDGKVGGAFCMSFVDDRSLVLLNWSGSMDSVQTTAHELGHAYHNTQLAHRTPLQRRLPMALAETASIFCETLMVESGLARVHGGERLAMLDTDLIGACQVVVDIHSRLLFETEVFARRHRRTLGVSELNEMMLAAQADAYGDGLDQSTAHPYMWAVKGHYYGSHFYNWPYTYGLLFGLGLYAEFRRDPERFQHGYDDLLSRVGMNSAEELGASFGLDVTDESFWAASLAVLDDRITQYQDLAARATP